MPIRIIKNICRYAQEQGHTHLRLEKKGADFLCVCGHNQKANYLNLDPNTKLHIIETFRTLIGAATHDLFTNKRFKIINSGQIISGRVSLLPADNGEKLIISLSANSPKSLRLSALGCNRPQQQLIKESLNKKGGVIIIAAGEENGASSTYRSLLSAIDDKRSVYSLESYPLKPVDGINTINLNSYPDTNSALQKVSSLDSEVIGLDTNLNKTDLKLIWDLTHSGRLLIITLPVANAAKALNLLKKSGISTKDIANQTLLIIAQKLFSRPCPKCLRPFKPGQTIKNNICERWPLATKYWPKKFYHSKNIAHCHHHQSTNKTAIFEIMHFLKDGRLMPDYQPLIVDALMKTELGLINIEDIDAWASPPKKI